jgi:hypothetical protein
MPFGDCEHISTQFQLVQTMMRYFGSQFKEPLLSQWGQAVRERAQPTLFPGILLENAPNENQPNEDTPPTPAPDRVFRDVGVGALHSDITRPHDDFMVLFRSSPYGGVSHGHASQNDFAVMKGGRALICTGGERFPHHGSPFHTEYAQQSISHNCVLVDGKGAINRDGHRGGEIVGFSSGKTFGCVSGEAANAYGPLLTKYRRHLLMIRPGVLILVDDLIAPKPSAFQWLLHALEKFVIDANPKTVISRRQEASLTGRLYASTDLTLSQTDAWPVAPDQGYPDLTTPLPTKRWHFTARTPATDRLRIAAIFSVDAPGNEPLHLQVSNQGERIHFQYGQSTAGCVDLSPDGREILQARCENEELNIQA